MKHEITLQKPILVNGQNVSDIEYDFDKINGDAFLEASDRSLSKMKEGGRAGAYELDYGLHLYLAYEAVVRASDGIDINDLERITGFDVVRLQQLGRNFITGKLEDLIQEEDSPESDSEPYSEVTQENSQLPSPIYEEDPSVNS
jgi:hypothetical protein